MSKRLDMLWSVVIIIKENHSKRNLTVCDHTERTAVQLLAEVVALAEGFGMIAAIAKELGVTRQAVYHWKSIEEGARLSDKGARWRLVLLANLDGEAFVRVVDVAEKALLVLAARGVA